MCENVKGYFWITVPFMTRVMSINADSGISVEIACNKQEFL
jgi:hypothetical protein